MGRCPSVTMLEKHIDTQNLRIPGPTPIPAEILTSLMRPMINHRGPEFAAILARVTEHLQYFFQTSQPVLCFPSSGSGAMEAAIVNCFSPGDKVLVASMGVFSAQLAKIAEIFGLDVVRIENEWGTAVTPDALGCAIEQHPHVRGILLTHNETSTGVTNDIRELARVARSRRPQALIVVDGVSSIGCLDLRMDEWDLDVVLTASQKGWMAPPGLAMIGVSQRAWAAVDQARLPRFYWDFRRALSFLEKKQTPYTPPVNVYFALDAALERMRAEGREAIFERHRCIGELTRQCVNDLGLELLAHPSCVSNTVTAIRLPPGVEGKTLIEALRRDEGVVIGDGLGCLQGKLVRIGHLGLVSEDEILDCTAALGRQMRVFGALPQA